jgi:hypothetical protein
MIHSNQLVQAKHASDPEKNWTWGIDGLKGTIADMTTLGIWEPVAGMHCSITMK